MLSDPEPAPAEAVPGPVLGPTPETAGDAPGASVAAAAGEGLPPEVAEGAPDASAAAAPSAEDLAAVAAEITAEATAEPTTEAPQHQGRRRCCSGCGGLAELFDLWQVCNYHNYVCDGPAPANGGIMTASARSLLENILDSADEAIKMCIRDRRNGRPFRTVSGLTG